MFVAVVPPADVLEDLEEHVAPRREAAPFRWTQPEGWHLTLAFMADVPDRALDDLVERLARAAARRTPVATRITGGGAFPNPARARALLGFRAATSFAAGVRAFAADPLRAPARTADVTER